MDKPSSSSSKVKASRDVPNSSDSDVDSLQIALDAEATPKKRSKHERLRKKPDMSKFDGSDLDRTIEETIEKCENFTPEVAKKMLLKLIKNEHILALSMLQAEEEEKNERVKKSSESDDDKKSESDIPTTPKLTRLKAKQLNKTLPVPASLNTSAPCEEVVALIQDEMRSDEEDDEYQPGDEENQSDEDVANTTFSDIESQPSTPGSALYYSEQDFDSPSKDGDFKVPKALSAQEQENISRRTRSKLCLTTTPIETIGSTFVPPDITTDMYDFDQDHEMDNEWKEFLNEFMMPLTNNEEDDEKSDPEYVAESVPVDKEELRPVRVSKKELNQLISELLEDSCQIFDTEPSTSSKRSSTESHSATKSKRQRVTSPTRNRLQSPKISSRMYTSEELLSTPPLLPCNFNDTSQPPASFSVESKKDKMQTLNSALNNFSDHSFEAASNSQQLLLTPQRMGFTTPTLMQSPILFPSPTLTPLVPTPQAPLEEPKYPQITGVYGSVENTPNQSLQSQSVLIMNAQNQLELTSPMNLINQAFCANGIVQLPQFQSVVIQVPTIDILQNRVNYSLPTFTQPLETVTDDVVIEPEVQPEPQNLIDGRKKKYKSTFSAFKYLESLPPPQEKTFDENLLGFTVDQKNAYEKQMRVHAQLLSQHFLQLFASPKWWEKSAPMKENLMELKSVVNPRVSPQTAEHIENCLIMCNDWEKELEEDNERNKKYATFLYEEHEYDLESSKKNNEYRGRFSNRLMEHMLCSKAIAYPELLPHGPFRSVTFKQVKPVASEQRLLAFGIQRFYEEEYKKLNRLNPIKIREPNNGCIARSIAKKYNSFRTSKHIHAIIESYRKHRNMNPIKYFFIHKKAPIPSDNISDVDMKKLVAPKFLRRGLLPKIWDTYMFSLDRLFIHPYTLPVEPSVEPTEEIIDLIEESDVEDETSLTVREVVPAPITTTVVDDLYRIEISYEDIPRINICFTQKSPQKADKENVSCVSLISPPSSPVKVREKSTEEKQNNLISILKKVSNNLDKSPAKKKSVNFLLPTPPRNRSSPRFADNITQRIGNPFLLTQKFFIVIETFFNNYIKNLKFRNEGQLPLIRFFHWTKTIDIYLIFLKKSIMNSKKRQNDSTALSGSTEAAPKTKKNVSSGEEFSKKLHRKLTDNRSLIMETDKSKSTIEKDCSYAYNYLERVKKTLLENGDDELYSEFMSMLTSFDPDCESVPELYQKIESLLVANYSDLVELFLTFMLPEHATEVGKFFERFVLNNMSNLLTKLNHYFNKQPSHLKKVYACLNELSNEQDLTMERLKAKVLPLLKSNQLLTDWFLEMFEKPIDSTPIEYESVYIKKSLSDSDNSIDNYEEVHSKDLIECENLDALNTCSVRYKNGKLLYHSTLLPAKISFLAHDAQLLPSKKTDEKSLCMHEIRKHVKFNDNKNTEKVPEEAKKPQKKLRKPKLCDAATLHAHAVRLNSVHAQHGEKLADLAHLLNSQNGNGHSDEKSPKKQRNVKKPSNSPKKSINKSPSSSSGHSVVVSPTSPSKAVQTAKKLRSLVDDNNEEPPRKKQKESEVVEVPKASLPAKSMEKKNNQGKGDKACEGASKKSEASTGKPQTTSEERGGCGWTRDEDQMILEQFHAGYGNKKVLLDILLTKLNRTRSEIDVRYEFLLDIVKMHQTKSE